MDLAKTCIPGAMQFDLRRRAAAHACGFCRLFSVVQYSVHLSAELVDHEDAAVGIETSTAVLFLDLSEMKARLVGTKSRVHLFTGRREDGHPTLVEIESDVRPLEHVRKTRLQRFFGQARAPRLEGLSKWAVLRLRAPSRKARA